MSPTQACDQCRQKKVRCNGNQDKTCLTCEKRKATCTWEQGHRKRGRKPMIDECSLCNGECLEAKRLTGYHYQRCLCLSSDGQQTCDKATKSTQQRFHYLQCMCTSPNGPRSCILAACLEILKIYRNQQYSIWPILNVDEIRKNFRALSNNREVLAMMIALSAATMAQLNLPSFRCCGYTMDDKWMEIEVGAMRAPRNEGTDYRQLPSPLNIATSFFLHVYHAKKDNRFAANAYLVEAINFTRSIHLDTFPAQPFVLPQTSVRSGMLFMLLWTSERGYASQHHTLPVSYAGIIEMPKFKNQLIDSNDVGLAVLTRLFVAYEPLRKLLFRWHAQNVAPSKAQVSSALRALQDGIESAETWFPCAGKIFLLARINDCAITTAYMQLTGWELKFPALGSERADESFIEFYYPIKVTRNLLKIMSDQPGDLEPLGRDQSVKTSRLSMAIVDLMRTDLSKNHYGETMKLESGDLLMDLLRRLYPSFHSCPGIKKMISEHIQQSLLESISDPWRRISLILRPEEIQILMNLMLDNEDRYQQHRSPFLLDYKLFAA